MNLAMLPLRDNLTQAIDTFSKIKPKEKVLNPFNNPWEPRPSTNRSYHISNRTNTTIDTRTGALNSFVY